MADLVHRVLQAVAPGDDNPIAVGAVLWRRQFGADAQQTGHGRASDDPVPVPVDTILQAGIAGGVAADQVVELEGRGVRQDHPLPHHLHATLPIAHLAVVAAEQARALGDQHMLTGGAVVDRFGHRGDDIARQI
ncbi:hypothetical protein D9M68_634300 [compost metagenome]